MRKSDHRNAIRSHEHFDELCAGAGLRGGRAPLLQRRLQGGGRGPRCCGSSSSARRGGPAARRTRTATTTARATRTSAAVARARRRPGRRCWRSRSAPHLAPEARRGPLRRHPHRPVLRPAACRASARVRILYVASDQGCRARRAAACTCSRWRAAWPARGHEVHAVVHAARAAPRARTRDGVRLAPRRAGAAAIASSASARGPRWRRIARRGAAGGGDGALLQLRRRGDPRRARARGIPSLLEVNSPVVDHPGSLKAALDALLLVRPLRRYRERLCRQAARAGRAAPGDRARVRARQDRDRDLGRERRRLLSRAAARARRARALGRPGGRGRGALQRQLPALARRARAGGRRRAGCATARDLFFLLAGGRRAGAGERLSRPPAGHACPTSEMPELVAAARHRRRALRHARGCASSRSGSSGRR